MGMQAIVMFLMLGILTGCASNRPLNERALVLVMAFAPGPHKQISVAFQIPTPQGLTSLTSGSTGSGSPGHKTSYTVFGRGSTLSQAFGQAQSQVNQGLYLGQLQAVIFSTRLSGAQFQAISSALTRIGQLDKTAFALATTAPLRQFMRKTPDSTPLPGLYYTTEFGCSQCQTVQLRRRVWSIEKYLNAPAQNLWLPLITLEPQGFHVDQMVIYRHNHAAKILSSQQTADIGYVLGLTSKGAVNLHWDGQTVSVRSLKANPKIRWQWIDGLLHIHVYLRVTGSVEEFPADLELGPHVRGLQQQTSAQLSSDCLTAVTKLSRNDLDPFTIGNAYEWQHPGTLSQWRDAYAHATWAITVTVRLQQLGDAT